MDEINNLQQIGNIIESIGFPVLVSIYLLYKFETRIKKLENSIEELNNGIKYLKNKE